MIRVSIDVSPVEGGGWNATIGSTALGLSIDRSISRLGRFPVPRPDDLPDDLDDAARELATATDPAVIDGVRINIAVKQPGPTDIAAFGTYLHAALFGKEWALIEQKAAGRHLELALCWPVKDWELARLPWEIMRAPGKPCPISWDAAITRIVPCQPREKKVHIRPKVLFIVGADMNDVSIRPGAEFFAVWERLQRAGISFDFRIAHRASSQQIEDEIESFQPSIVHFICHGQEAGGAGVIDLISADKSGKLVSDQRDARRCLDLLRNQANSYPSVVVLSACYSGSAASPALARVDAPLAAALVEGGVPIVVGMGGQVSDLACRLFARRFYEALLGSEPVTDATFEGRRAGMKHGSDPELSVDWALPMLFMAEGLDPVVDVDTSEAERVRRRAERARRLRNTPGPPNPAAFCDRIDVMEAQRALTRPGQPTRVLVIEETDFVVDPLQPNDLGKFGKTRVLREIAARIMLDGHLPCLVTRGKGDSPPTSAEKLLATLSRAVTETAKQVRDPTGIDSQLMLVSALLAAKPGACADQLDEAVRDKYDRWCDERADYPDLPARLIVEALCVDLRAMAELGRDAWQSPDLRVVVLVDDVHLFDVATRVFTELIGQDGVGDIHDPVPVVFAFSSQPRQDGCQTSIEVLRQWVEDNSQDPAYLKYIALERFKSPDPEPFSTIESLRQDPLALIYQQYLLNLSPGIVLLPGAPVKVTKWFLKNIHKEVLGVPSRMYVSKVILRAQRVIDHLLSQQADGLFNEKTIESVDDEQALAQFRDLV